MSKSKKVVDVALNKKANKRIFKGLSIGVISLAILLSEFAVAGAGTKLSSLSTGWQAEAKAVIPVVLLLISGIGVIIASVAVISGVMAKKNQEPLKWQLWGVIGGGLAVIVPVLVLATAGSVGSGQGNANSTMSELGIKF